MKINEIQNGIVAEFSELEDWLARYRYLINLAGNFEPMDKKYKKESNLINGCQSELWLYGKCEDGRMEFFADSSAVLTKGIVSLILRVLNHQPPGDIVESDLYFIDRIGLKSNLSPSRSNGISSIINAIKRSAGAEKNKCELNKLSEVLSR